MCPSLAWVRAPFVPSRCRAGWPALPGSPQCTGIQRAGTGVRWGRRWSPDWRGGPSGRAGGLGGGRSVCSHCCRASFGFPLFPPAQLASCVMPTTFSRPRSFCGMCSNLNMPIVPNRLAGARQMAPQGPPLGVGRLGEPLDSFPPLCSSRFRSGEPEVAKSANARRTAACLQVLRTAAAAATNAAAAAAESGPCHPLQGYHALLACGLDIVDNQSGCGMAHVWRPKSAPCAWSTTRTRRTLALLMRGCGCFPDRTN